MCKRQKIQYRCGHQVYSGGIEYCSKAKKGAGGKRIRCDHQRTTTMRSSGDVCGKSSCQLSILRGKWDCCKCNECGNKFPLCDRGSCNHEVCGQCRAARS
ncbi:uncharacterized protein BO97DRAFT_22979 [Aspergillus homomorphus CBS 101889]|uniref:Uncharacterized protein n=1 Tax=Aspergillus homomorphus (strain CBS 101889) TaxID=1450537 RepID=A0A395HF84_ASPHC|nr:hypothetical protein BO97DRAFT_22979 [Aspergillus homomorphus CBS 101889]RAL06621.1 hypothetical protein BO97DRAFT_22979 [Aspergillus homomorphus CBS 101889]